MNDSNPHRKRIRHYDGLGHARELTFSCHQRKPFFTKLYVIEWILEAMERTKERHPIHIWAYVVMPEHVHLLVWPTDPSCEIADVLRSLKSSVAHRSRNHLLKTNPGRLKGGFHFWQAGPGYDRNLYEPAVIWNSINYIHMNPVRRQLCTRPEEWPWSSIQEYAGIAVTHSLLDRESLPTDPRTEHGYAKP